MPEQFKQDPEPDPGDGPPGNPVPPKKDDGPPGNPIPPDKPLDE